MPRWLMTPILLLFLAGCPGERPDDDDDNGSDADDFVPPVVEITPASPGGTPLRRLTPTEYRNTVRDLFPDQNFSLGNFPLAVDTAINGFQNNAEVQATTAVLVEQQRNAARILAAVISPQMNLGCDGAGFDEELLCVGRWLEETGWKFLRRPWDDEELEAYKDFFADKLAELTYWPAIELLLQALFQSPDFLYRVEFGLEKVGTESDEDLEYVRVSLEPYEIASRLSYLVLGSLPDDELFESARSGALSEPAEIEAQARRLLEDPRARAAVSEYHRQWLGLDRLESMVKDPNVYGYWNTMMRGSMAQEPIRFVESVVFDQAGTLDALMTTPGTWVDSRIAPLYQVDPPPDEEWAWVELDPTQRAGLFTQTGFLSLQAHAGYPSPVKRGHFLLDRVLCLRPPPPPDNENFFPPVPSEDPDLTNRERYEERTAAPACQQCHAAMDPLGYPFESLDGIGQHRSTDAGQPVNTVSELVGTDVDGEVQDVVDLMDALAESVQVEQCYALHWFRYGMGRSEREVDQAAIQQIADEFVAADGNIKELLVAVAGTERFRTRLEVVEEEE